jgi:16S rRNA (guanine966-N2)-methyltransferase
MRIIAGSHRGRPIAAPDDERIRPTADRIRESLFNILRVRLGAFSGKRVLDGFAGTGALGLEALSRGADFTAFIDNDRKSLDLCRHNAATLGLADKAGFHLIDFTRMPVTGIGVFDLVLLDPPYGKGLGAIALSALRVSACLAPGALAVIEADKAQPEAIPPGFSLVDSRDYGRTRIMLLT